MVENEQLSQLIEHITKQVYRQEAEFKLPKALVLIETNLDNELEEYQIAKALEELLIGHKIYYMNSAQQDYQMIGKRLENKQGFSIAQSNEFAKIILIKPSVTTLSKLAHLILDEEYVHITYQGLLCGKQVMVGKLSDWSYLKPALQQEIGRLVEKIQSYGIEVMDQKANRLEEENETLVIGPNKRFLSLKDIEGKTISALSVSKHTIIGAMAKDYIKQKQIMLKKGQD
ncbi:MAG: hypothetical protein K0S71_2381 [Clostridia bacterium]|jgi:ethanolamine utilization protein|nr:hypothetical protein [Clostridia bacterium]